ncbi:MAG: hypothetical protein HC902_02690 [Calothrix sp. SM1_5_4]|nr:hypothetical protein [Calothrix sp. SM1_5_4]
MSYHHFYKTLDQKARRLFPSLAELPKIDWDYLISPLEIRLPRSVLNNATAAIRALYKVSRLPGYGPLLENSGAHAAANDSVLMAYDFHTNEAGECFLVEINTNASGFLLSSLMHMAHAPETDPDAFEPWRLMRAAFERELHLTGRTLASPRVAITDEAILQQKMYAEFLMYRDWFARYGWNAGLCESKAFSFDGRVLRDFSGREIDLVYNRLTDFYLEDPAHAALREALAAGAACVTPNPKEYWLLADKQRLVQFTQPGFLEQTGAAADDIAAIRKVLIPTFEKSAFASEEDIWSERRSLFFKPKRSHGGKSVYRGESVSRKVFERLMSDGDILMQKFQPAQRMPSEDPRSVLSNWKFDLRFYVYADQVHMAVARAYQGQVTNFSSPMGGFTFVGF